MLAPYVMTHNTEKDDEAGSVSVLPTIARLSSNTNPPPKPLNENKVQESTRYRQGQIFDDFIAILSFQLRYAPLVDTNGIIAAVSARCSTRFEQCWR